VCNIQGCSGAGTRGNDLPTPFSCFALTWVRRCLQMACFFWVRSHTSFGSTTSLAASEKAWFVNWTKHSWTHSAVSSKKDQCQLFSFVDILDFTCLNRKVHACRQKFSDFFSQYARKQEMRKKLSCGLCGADSQGLGGVLKSSFCAEAARKRSWTFQ